MKQGGDRRTSNRSSRTNLRKFDGFTIVEVLIVLAVTGVLFVSAVLLINGRQNRTEFTTAINNAQQEIQQVINETQSGFSGTSLRCQGNTAGGAPSFGSTDQGCIFLGKVLQFGTDTNSGQLVVYPIVGNQQHTTGGSSQEVSDLPTAYPTAVPSGQTTIPLQSGLMVDHASSGAVGIMTSLASYSGCSGLCSGSQQFSLYGISGTGVNTSISTVSGLIDKPSAASFGSPINMVTVCLASGTTQQSGQITIGGSGGAGSLAVSLRIFEGSTTCTT